MIRREIIGRSIFLHRRLVLACYPEAEAGPAAIFSTVASWASMNVTRARAFERGEPGMERLGGRSGVPQSVTIVSPLVPGLADLAGNADWQLWDGGKFPESYADIVIVWRPLQVLRRLSLGEAAHWLLESTLGGSAVYDALKLDQMLNGYSRRHSRRQN